MAKKKEDLNNKISISGRDKEKRLHIRTSDFCNNNCVFCIDALERAERKTARGEGFSDTADDIKLFSKYISELRALGIDKVIFTGNEPTLNPNLINFVRLVKAAKFKEIRIISNGNVFYYKKELEKLLSAGINFVTISAHGHNAKIQDAISRTRGSFKLMAGGLKNITILRRKFVFNFTINSTVNKLNYKTLYNFLNFCFLFGPDQINLNLVIPQGNAEKFFDVIIPEYSNVVNSFKTAIKKLEKDGKPVERIFFTGLPLCLLGGFERYFNIRESAFVQRRGNFSDLDRLRSDAWKTKAPKCRSCRKLKICGGIYEKYYIKFGDKELKPF